MKTWFQKNYPLLLILTASFGLRLCLLLMRGTLWFDEIFSVHFSSLPWQEAIKYWGLETNPFLHTLFLRGYIYLFGDGDNVVRIPSIIFGLLTIWAVYWFAQKVFSRRAAIISSAIVSLSGIFVFTNTEARVYSLLVFLTCVSFYLFYLILVEQKQNTKIWLLYLLVQTLLLYSHLTAIVIIIIQILIFSFYRLADQKVNKKFYLTQLTSFLLWCFWLIPAIISKFHASTFSGWFFTYDRQMQNLLTIFVTLFVNANLSDFTFTLFSIILLIFVLIIFKEIIKGNFRENKLLIILLLWGLVPPILGACLGQYVTKYFVFSLPALALLMAWAIDKIANHTARTILTIGLFALIIPSTLTIATEPIFSWYSMTNFIQKQETPNSIIFLIPFNEELSIRRYYHGSTPIMGVYPMDDNLSLDERIVRYNWMTLYDGDYDKWMQEKTKNKDRVFFLQYDGSYGDTIMWFVNRGWKVIDKRKADGHIGIHLFELDAPTSTSCFTLN